MVCSIYDCDWTKANAGTGAGMHTHLQFIEQSIVAEQRQKKSPGNPAIQKKRLYMEKWYCVEKRNAEME